MRKTKTIVIDKGDSRDAGKHFHIEEKSAYDIEWWATRAFMALAKAGVDIGDGTQDLQHLAVLGFKALGKLDPLDAKPLLNEMMECVHVIPNPANPIAHRAPLDGEIEEVTTLLRLRAEVFMLHTGFIIPDSLSMGSTSGRPSGGSSSTPTSRQQSGQSSRPGSRR